MQIQLELNLEAKTSDEMQLHYLLSKMNEIQESFGKTRRKLFAELSETKEICKTVQKENEALRRLLNEQSGKTPEWAYLQNGLLFERVG